MAVLLDTSFLFSFFNEQDPYHEKVKKTYEKILDGEFGVPILLDFVFDEFVSLVQFRTGRNRLATELGNLLLADCKKYIMFSWINSNNFWKAWDLFQNQSGSKYLSFTDCILLEFARANQVSKIATLDRHFRSWVATIPD